MQKEHLKMHLSMRSVRLSLTAAVAVCALFALTASSAFAAPATWSASGSMKWTTSSYSLSYNGSSLTCTPYAPSWAVGGAGGSTFSYFGKPASACGGAFSNFELTVNGNASQAGGVYSLTVAGGAVNASPFGGYNQVAAVGTFTNGSGATPSKVTFTNVTIGTHGTTGLPLKITGTFNVTTGSGGLLTLS
jgi:hypothetical protein